MHGVCYCLGIIWDEAEALQVLADHSRPRVMVATAGRASEATKFAILLAARIRELDRLPAEQAARPQ